MAKKFPDLTGDGKVTQKDILLGRGVSLAKGGQIVYGDKDKKKIKKVAKGLAKASKTHAKQSKILSSIKLKKGGKPKSRVNEAGNYTKPEMRKRQFNRIKAGSKGGKPGQWSARKAQMLAKAYKDAGGGYK